MKHTTASGAHSPNIVWGKLRSWQFVCLPTLHSLSLDCLRRGFRRTPTNHTMRLTWTLLTMPSLNYTVAGTLTFLHTQNKETICIVLSFDQRDIGFSVLIILTNLWKLMRLPEGPFYTTSQFSNAVSNQPSPLRAGHHERGVELFSLFWVRSSIVTMGISY